LCFEVTHFSLLFAALEKYPNATIDSVFCQQCFKKVASDLAFEYRKSIPDADLPPEVVARPKCHWGKNCRTATHNSSHAGRYNHICEQTRNQ
jgi:E3 ubiquitin-protein ligase CHFR